MLAIIVVGHGGRHGLTLHPLSPTASPHGFHGLATGFVFAALSFVGFEAAATLGDEVRDPRRLVPRAILLSCAVRRPDLRVLRLGRGVRAGHRRRPTG